MGISKINVDSKIDNSFEEQHHHLLSCLEHATVSHRLACLYLFDG